MSLHPFSTHHQDAPALACEASQAAPPDEAVPYHAQPVNMCLQLLKTTLQGLSQQEAEERGKGNPGNTGSREMASLRPAWMFLNNLKRKFSFLFLAIAILSFVMGQYVNGLFVLAAMLLNGGIQGLIQWKALQSQKISVQNPELRCTVRREGQSVTIQAHELVIGDILLIAGGQVLPADARLVSSTQLQVDESPLTGESVLVPKNANDVLHPAEDVTALSNMVFAGTLIKTGKGEAIVTALGHQTVMGRIASLAQKTEKRESPFTRQLNTLSWQIFLITLAVVALIIGIGSARHLPLMELVQVGLVIAIAAFPETIPGLASLILSLGIGRLNENKVIVKNFQALETVGDLSVICTDKTGTLTENYLLLDKLYLPEMGAITYESKWQNGDGIPTRSVEECLRVGRLNNGTMLEGLRSGLMGDPIDVALYRAAPASLEAGYHARLTIPFDPVTLRSATLCETPDGQTVSMIKGAPESVMEQCRFYMKPDGTLAEMTLSQRTEFLTLNRTLAYEHNLRVVGFAQKPILENDDSGPYANAIFIGWVCLLDPPKPGVHKVLKALQDTGARMIMITGDQKATAEMTARELGLISRNSDEVWLRSDLQACDSTTIPSTVKVFARTKPEEKLAIVESLQQGHQVVAMVGDGVNDSPALQKSDVAIGMGLQGAQTAKDCADIILMNDRLDGIVFAILESRIARRKIQSCLQYILSCNLGMILWVAASAVSGFGLPLTVLHLLWLSLVVVSVPALVLAIQPPPPLSINDLNPADDNAEEAGDWQPSKALDKDAQGFKTLQPLSRQDAMNVLLWGGVMAVTTFGSYALCLFLLKLPPTTSATAAFWTLAFSQTLHLLNVQTAQPAVWQARPVTLTDLLHTPITWLVMVVAVVLQALTVYTPIFNAIMGTAPLPLVALGCASLSSLIMIVFSLKKT
jgi:Ca2+-transporting ATPase